MSMSGCSERVKWKSLAMPSRSVESCSNLPSPPDLFAIHWTGDDLNQFPSAFALLQTIPADFQATDELLRFFEGEQWDRALYAARTSAQRPTLTVNMLPRIYALALDAQDMKAPESGHALMESRKLKCWIAHCNRDAQMLHNYLVSAVAEREATNPDARLISPEQAGEAARQAYAAGSIGIRKDDVNMRDTKLWGEVAMAAIDYYLKQPKV